MARQATQLARTRQCPPTERRRTMCEIDAERITAWREYFDLALFTAR
jgi:hypothetical protein